MKLYGLAGPTATAKTEAALQLSTMLNAVIVSCDSVLVYKLLDIGANKPPAAQLAQHQLVNLVYPWEAYSAYQFLVHSHALLPQIAARGKNILFVGGTMLYFKLLCEGFSVPFHDPLLVTCLAQQSRQELERELYAHHGDSMAVQQLDKRKLIRQVEIMVGRATGLPPALPIPPLSTLKLCAFFSEDRTAIYQRIEGRLAQMLQNGLMAEIDFLYHHPSMQRQLPAMQSIGYKQGWAYLAGEITYPDFYTLVLRATNRLAKKQCTWLRHWKHELKLIDSELPLAEKVQQCFTYFQAS